MIKEEKISILIADDDNDTRRLLSEYLNNMDLKADTAEDGKRALELLDCKKYDFVFLDCNMPEVTGLEVAGVLKTKIPHPRIIMMTGYDPIDEAFAKAVGVDIYIKKPILLKEVENIIRGGDGK